VGGEGEGKGSGWRTGMGSRVLPARACAGILRRVEETRKPVSLMSACVFGLWMRLRPLDVVTHTRHVCHVRVWMSSHTLHTPLDVLTHTLQCPLRVWASVIPCCFAHTGATASSVAASPASFDLGDASVSLSASVDVDSLVRLDLGDPSQRSSTVSDLGLRLQRCL
jgi:hypothetical protein